MLIAVSYGSAVPLVAFADGGSKEESAAKPAAKIEAPAPLTERERWLLDRIEQLEKRMAEMEVRGSSSAPAAISTAQPASSAASESASFAPAATVAAPGSNVLPAEKTTTAASNTVQEKTPTAKPQKAEPFAFADFTWLTGNARTKESPMDTKFFTPEIRADVDYVYDFAHPKDDTIGGSSEIFRSNEVHVTQLGVGGDFHYDNVRARVMTQFGLYSETTPRNDASPARGQWNLDNAYRYLSEAYGGYHFNALHGINVDAGIFMSY